MLQTMHQYARRPIRVYGMNRGTVGFLMNEFRLHDLPARISAAHESKLYPLQM